mgnify:CR=1 FL=1
MLWINYVYKIMCSITRLKDFKETFFKYDCAITLRNLASRNTIRLLTIKYSYETYGDTWLALGKFGPYLESYSIKDESFHHWFKPICPLLRMFAWVIHGLPRACKLIVYFYKLAFHNARVESKALLATW